MRRLLLILIALSLSWVTMGYACSMSGAIPQLACCCDAGVPHSCPEPARNCSVDAMLDAPGGTCCSFIATSGASIQGQSETLTTPHLPPLNVSAAELAARCPTRNPSWLLNSLAHDRGAKPIYLLTGRLRR